MVQVTKESLARKIRQLEEYESDKVISMNEEYQLEAYRMLAMYVRDCKHEFNWHPGKQKAICEYCQKVKVD